MAKHPRRPRDPNQLAKLIVDLSIGEARESQESKKARGGRAGGLKGGRTRMGALSAEQRHELAKKGAAKRWKKPAPEKGAG